MILATPEHIAHHTAQGWWGTLTCARLAAAAIPLLAALCTPTHAQAPTYV